MSEFKLHGNNFDSVEADIATLKELFPSIVTGDNEIDFDELREIFDKSGETVVDDSEEHYKFTWWGKKEAKRVAKQLTTKTLRPSKKDSKNWDDTENIYIEGDNLDALKILLGSYRNSIKMIYIDPPYNTGHDFVYKDDRSENIKEHLENTNQLSEDGFLFENAKTDGKYHSNWLNMLYPRLYIARKLLTDDGVIFISIDDNEVENLKKVCNEIFGEENFVCQFVWKSKLGKVGTTSTISTVHEYILCFGKKVHNLSFKMIETKKEGRIENLRQWGQADRREDRPSMFYPIEIDGKSILPIKEDGSEGRWRVGQEKARQLLNNGLLEVRKKGDIYNIYRKFENSISVTPYDTLLLDEVGTTAKGAYVLKDLGLTKVFDYSKPIDLIQFFTKLSTDEDDYILDFFSGSSSTAHAIFELNKNEKTSRKFIMVQIPEKTDKKSNAYISGFNNICEIGKERIRRAGDKILEESENKDLDIGFKVFKVDESNFIPWNPIIENTNDANQAILATENNIVDGRSELDLIYELLLKLNMELTCSIDEEIINNHKFYIIDDGYVLICLDSNIEESITKDLLKLKDDLMTEHCEVILRDDALDDNSAMNIYETLKSNNVEFHTI